MAGVMPPKIGGRILLNRYAPENPRAPVHL